MSGLILQAVLPLPLSPSLPHSLSYFLTPHSAPPSFSGWLVLPDSCMKPGALPPVSRGDVEEKAADQQDESLAQEQHGSVSPLGLSGMPSLTLLLD